ncbi:hypothetical protein H6G33_38385 [Calothrix sp. FACHB-1219]|uniref:hypothetical protein n=1 Tax=Calothrix sp. FACHB-1219 TaxID=2692778 RepID=UPI0016879ACF|nr:hypothetical protein [Calothrix sp. FACHB-1219]MBD2222786.1 hypothetical protein [Calothrix sp. FACHB-1219]
MTGHLTECWIVDGVSSAARPSANALYIKPMLLNSVALAPNSLQTLLLDNNVFTDLIEARLPKNNANLVQLLKSNRIELNPVFAMLERQPR